MRLTRAGEYAVRCMCYLAKQGEGAIVSREEIAGQNAIPIHFLAKIAQQLAHAGFITIRQGAKGGLILVKKPADITLLQVVEAMIGEIYLNDCILRPENCGSSGACAVHRVWLKAREQLRATLAAVSLQDILEEGLCAPILPGQQSKAPRSESQ